MVGTMNNCNMKYALMVVLIACSTAWTGEKSAPMGAGGPGTRRVNGGRKLVQPDTVA